MAADPRPASTVALLRDGAGGVEIWMLRRPARSSFAPGAFVFPGGAVDAHDGEPESDAAYRTCAVREVLEESGVLIGGGADGAGSGDVAAAVASARRDLLDGAALDASLALHGLRADRDAMTYIGHFITPEHEARRYDTRFYAVRAPEAQSGAHHAAEAVESGWHRPADVLRHPYPILMPPTRMLCHEFTLHATVDEALASMGSDPIEAGTVTPELALRWMRIGEAPSSTT